jgi:hypothetical protein
MEALRADTDPEAIARRIHELQQQWRLAADVPRPQGESLWKRFKAVHDELWARCEAHFAGQAEVRADNLIKKAALCEPPTPCGLEQLQTAEEIAQAQWKAIGPVTRGQEKAIWERFCAACDRFFTRRQEDWRSGKSCGPRTSRRRSALREGRSARRFDGVGADGRRHPQAPGRVENDRRREEEPVRSDLAALPRRL